MNEGTIPGFEEIGTIFFQDGYRLAREFLSQDTGQEATTEGIIRETILQLMAAVYESIDGLIESFRNRCGREGLAVECKKACTYCCSQAVLVSNHEVLAIGQYMENRINPETREEIRTRTAEKHLATREMSAMEFLHHIHPCPFLAGGECIVYPVRPMACRCYLSASSESCREQYDDPADRSRVAALYEFPLRAGRGMNEGIRSALMEKGLSPSEWLLETFMDTVFEEENILDKWLAGDTPFNIRELSPEETRYMREYYESQSDPSGDQQA